MNDIKSVVYNPTQLKMMQSIAEYHISKHPDLQVIKAIQELAELIEELGDCLGNKLVLHGEMYLDLFKEIFDAEFMILQMKMLFIDDEGLYNDIVNSQLHREMKRRGLE